MKYDKARLAERYWHKIVIWTDRGGRPHTDIGTRVGLRDDIRRAIIQHVMQPCMVRHGGDYSIIMLASDEDYVALKLALNISPSEYRGFGDWARKRYNSAKTNRIRTTDE